MAFSLKGKVALVTGARQGIGEGIALELGRAGANVMLVDLDAKKCAPVVAKLLKLGVKADAISADVSDHEAALTAIAATVKSFKKLDILVNNAGIYPYKPVLEMTEEDWDKVLDVNLKGVFNFSQAAARQMASQGKGGRIVNVSSIASIVGFSGLTHYCASKGGVNGFTRALALELAQKNVTVNAVLPGAIDTPGATGLLKDPKTREVFLQMIPAHRFGLPKDIAAAVLYLASDEASYVTGQTITVDGGWTSQ